MKCQETGKSDKKRPNVRKKTAKKEGKQEKTVKSSGNIEFFEKK